jgi:hypothetical protein
MILIVSLTLKLGLVGLGLGLTGSILLAVSLNQIVNALALATDAHDIALAGLVDSRPGAPVVRFTGTDEHVERGRARAARLTKAGFWLLALSFAFQGAALLIPALSGPATPTPVSAPK